VHEFSWDVDLIEDAINRGIERVLTVLGSQGARRTTAERLAELIELSIRATDVGVPVEADNFQDHRAISLSGELTGEYLEEIEEPEADEEVGEG
jgi:copper homeostasis protein CutC